MYYVYVGDKVCGVYTDVDEVREYAQDLIRAGYTDARIESDNPEQDSLNF